MEIWKNISFLENKYAVSNYGKIRNNHTNRILKTKIDKKNYERLTLSHKTIKHNILVHRLVLNTFLPIKNSKNYEVNHKDWNPRNNNLCNLEWCTKEENLNLKISNFKSYKKYKTLLYLLGDDKLKKTLEQIIEGLNYK